MISDGIEDDRLRARLLKPLELRNAVPLAAVHARFSYVHRPGVKGRQHLSERLSGFLSVRIQMDVDSFCDGQRSRVPTERSGFLDEFRDRPLVGLQCRRPGAEPAVTNLGCSAEGVFVNLTAQL